MCYRYNTKSPLRARRMTSNKHSYRSRKVKPSLSSSSSSYSSTSFTPDSDVTSGSSCEGNTSCSVAWSGFETIGMRRAKCSLLLQEDIIHDAIIKKLPKQRVLIDRGVRTNASNAAVVRTNTSSNVAISTNHALSSFSSTTDTVANTEKRKNYSTDEPYHVDFDGATILQLEPSISPIEPQSVMPITITVAGKCVLTPENYVDFQVMMRTKEQSCAMNVPPNGAFDWPDIASFLLCPVCSHVCSIPQDGDRKEHEYWMVFYPLLQIAVRNHDQNYHHHHQNHPTTASTNNTNPTTATTNHTNNNNTNMNEMVLSTRTICRLTCLDCMDDLLEGLSLNVIPGGLCKERSQSRRSDNVTNHPTPSAASNSTTTTTAKTTTATTTISTTNSTNTKPIVKGLAFSLPVIDILAEAGSVSFLEGGPPRPETHEHLDDILDAWSLYNLWESSGAWEALQNDYRNELAKMLSPVPKSTLTEHLDDAAKENDVSSVQASWTKRIGQKCSSESCHRIHGKTTMDNGDICRLNIKCQDCHSEFYCSKACRESSRISHASTCRERRKQRDERRERSSSKQIQCDTCARRFSCMKMKKCSSCRHATYCSVDCQKVDWERHKTFCKR